MHIFVFLIVYAILTFQPPPLINSLLDRPPVSFSDILQTTKGTAALISSLTGSSSLVMLYLISTRSCFQSSPLPRFRMIMSFYWNRVIMYYCLLARYNVFLNVTLQAPPHNHVRSRFSRRLHHHLRSHSRAAPCSFETDFALCPRHSSSGSSLAPVYSVRPHCLFRCRLGWLS